MALADSFLKKSRVSSILMKISLENLSWESSSILKNFEKKISLVERQGFADFGVRTDCFISEILL